MISDEVTRARERKHLSKHDIARMTGLSYQHIHNVEVGRRPLTLDVFRKLDKHLRFPCRILVAFIRCHGDSGPDMLTRASLGLLVLGLG